MRSVRRCSMGDLPENFEFKDSRKLFKQGDVEGLIEALGHPDVQKSRLLRDHVVEKMGDLKDHRAVPALIEVLEHDSKSGLRIAAAQALGKIDDSRSLGPLRAARDDPDRKLRLWAIDSLGLLRDRESVDALIECLAEEDSWIREYAARALREICDHSGLFRRRISWARPSANSKIAFGRGRGRSAPGAPAPSLPPGYRSSLDVFFSSCRAMIRSWICWVPSKMSRIFESRAHFSSSSFSP
jgi:hypothetical protein